MQDKIGLPLDEIHIAGHVPQCKFLYLASRFIWPFFFLLPTSRCAPLFTQLFLVLGFLWMTRGITAIGSCYSLQSCEYSRGC